MNAARYLVLALATACSGGSTAKPAVLVDLSASLDAVRADFNAHAAEPRFIALLSAT
jgi:hypothetical protein